MGNKDIPKTDLLDSDFCVKDFKKDIGRDVRTMPQVKINGEVIGGYHQLVEYFDDQGLVNFKGEKVEQG